MKPSRDELCAWWAQGAWEHLAPALRRIVESRLGAAAVPRHERDEIAALVLERAWQQPTPPRNPAGWATTVAVHALMDALKVERGRVALAPVVYAAMVEHHDSATALDVLVAHEDRARVRHTVARLAPIHREVLWWQYWHGRRRPTHSGTQRARAEAAFHAEYVGTWGHDAAA